MIDSPRSMEEVSKRMEILQEIRDFCELPEGCFRNLIPIGDWGAGWGPLCIDLSRPEENIDPDNEFTWSLVWFDHEEFDWDKMYLCDDGLLHGKEGKYQRHLHGLIKLFHALFPDSCPYGRENPVKNITQIACIDSELLQLFLHNLGKLLLSKKFNS